MLTIDLDLLLQPISADKPSGENLEYDSAFLALERIAQHKPEQQMGGAVVAAEPPDYKAVFEQSLALFSRTKDLRVANHVVQALLHSRGFEGMADGLDLIQGLLQRYWPNVHPQLDPDDNNDPTMRITALAGLCTNDVLVTLRASPLIRSRSFGPVGLREMAIANGELPQPKEGPKYEAAMIEAAFLEVELGELERLVAGLARATGCLATIDKTFETNANTSGPEFSPLAKLLYQATSATKPRLEARQAALAAEAAEAAQAAADALEATAAGAPVPRRSLTGEISTREDVLRALDKLCAYYAQHEPSSPLPLLLKRCKRLVPMSFKEIVSDLAPDALGKLELITGKGED